jgi:hypothetical protein
LPRTLGSTGSIDPMSECSLNSYGKTHPMITAGTDKGIWIDPGKDEAGMTLQYRDVKNGYIVWRDVMKDGKVVKSPVDIDKLPAGRYRLV